jgi:hypothetical protein
VHVLRLRWHAGVHLRLVPKVIPFVLCEDVVLLDDGWEVVALVRLLGSRLTLVVDTSQTYL